MVPYCVFILGHTCFYFTECFTETLNDSTGRSHIPHTCFPLLLVSPMSVVEQEKLSPSPVFLLYSQGYCCPHNISDTRCMVVFLPPAPGTRQFYDPRWVSCNFNLPGAGARSHKTRAQSHKTAPTSHQVSSPGYTCLLTN